MKVSLSTDTLTLIRGTLTDTDTLTGTDTVRIGYGYAQNIDECTATDTGTDKLRVWIQIYYIPGLFFTNK